MGQPGLIPGEQNSTELPVFPQQQTPSLSQQRPAPDNAKAREIGKEMEVAVACVWQVDKTFRKRTMFLSSYLLAV